MADEVQQVEQDREAENQALRAEVEELRAGAARAEFDVEIARRAAAREMNPDVALKLVERDGGDADAAFKAAERAYPDVFERPGRARGGPAVSPASTGHEPLTRDDLRGKSPQWINSNWKRVSAVLRGVCDDGATGTDPGGGAGGRGVRRGDGSGRRGCPFGRSRGGGRDTDTDTDADRGNEHQRASGDDYTDDYIDVRFRSDARCK